MRVNPEDRRAVCQAGDCGEPECSHAIEGYGLGPRVGARLNAGTCRVDPGVRRARIHLDVEAPDRPPVDVQPDRDQERRIVRGRLTAGQGVTPAQDRLTLKRSGDAVAVAVGGGAY
jgi:hypothetical protein